MQKGSARTPPAACARRLLCFTYVPGPSCSWRMRCAQCWMLDCTIRVVSTGEAVIRSCLEEPPRSLWGGRGHCSALWRALPATPPTFLPSVTLFSPLICSLPARWGWSAAHTHKHKHTHTPPGSSHRIVHPPTEPQFKPARHHGDLFLLLFFNSWMPSPGESTACTPVRWRARACSHQRRRRIYLRVRCPHTVRAISPARTHARTPPIATEEERGKTHRITRMGFYGTLKMIFYKVSRVFFFFVFFFCLCFPPPPRRPCHLQQTSSPSLTILMLDSLVSPSLSLTRLSRQIVRPLRRMNGSEADPQRRRFNCPGPICCVVLCYVMG